MADRFRTVRDCPMAFGGDPVPAGQEFYRFKLNDYGMKSDHERITREEHINLTEDPEGGYPFICVPLAAVEPSDDQ